MSKRLDLKDKADAGKFAAYLTQNGATVLEPTNQYEVLRYKLNGCGTLVIYRNKTGRLTIPEATHDHIDSFLRDAPIEKHERLGAKENREIKNRLLDRDGGKCVVCGKPLGDDITVEHFLSVSDGGNSLPNNLALAHRACNEALGNLPIVLKIELIVKARMGDAP